MDPLIPLFVKDQDDESFDLETEVKSLAAAVGWTNLLREVFYVLARPGKKHFWHQASSIVYWAVSDGIPLPYSLVECAATLYHCLELHPNLGQSGLADGENLVWSIVSRLKGVSYESSWNPRAEPEIAQRLSQLRAGG